MTSSPTDLTEGARLAHHRIGPLLDVLDGGICYVERLQGRTNLRYFDFARRQSTVIAENLGFVVAGLSASADGRTILFPRVDSSADELMLVENFR